MNTDETHMVGELSLRRPTPGVDHWHPLSSTLIPAERAPHANRGTFRCLHRDRRPAKLRSQAAFLRGAINNLRGLHANGKAMPWFYMHSSARPAEAPTVELQMAA